MDREALQKAIGELRFAAQLPAHILASLADASEPRSLGPRCSLFREGAENAELFLIRSGRVALEMNVLGRGVVRLITLGPGEMVGWSALLDQGKMTTSAITLEEVEAIAISGEKLRVLSEQNAEFGFQLMRRMARALATRLVATRLQMIDMFSVTDPPPGNLAGVDSIAAAPNSETSIGESPDE